MATAMAHRKRAAQWRPAKCRVGPPAAHAVFRRGADVHRAVPEIVRDAQPAHKGWRVANPGTRSCPTGTAARPWKPIGHCSSLVQGDELVDPAGSVSAGGEHLRRIASAQGLSRFPFGWCRRAGLLLGAKQHERAERPARRHLPTNRRGDQRGRDLSIVSPVPPLCPSGQSERADSVSV